METKETYWQRARRLKREALIDLSMAEGYYLAHLKGKRYEVRRSFAHTHEKRTDYGMQTAEAVMYMGLRRLTKALRIMEDMIRLAQAKKNLEDRVKDTTLRLVRSDAFVKVIELGGENSPYLAKVAAAEQTYEIEALVKTATQHHEEEGLTPEQVKELRSYRKMLDERREQVAASFYRW